MSKMIESNETFAAIFTELLEERPANGDMPGNYSMTFRAYKKDKGFADSFYEPIDLRVFAENMDVAIQVASKMLPQDKIYYLITVDWEFSMGPVEKHEQPDWSKGYKEVKNFIHNEMGITRSEIMDIFATIARDEMQGVIGEENAFIKSFIRSSVRDILREEMVNAVNNGRYQHGPFSVRDDNFNKFISNAMKDEIGKILREQFDVGIQIEQKTKEEE